MKVCAEPGCPRLQRETRCLEHRRQREQARGTRQERGYDAAHDAERRRLASYLANGVTLTCWRCDKPIQHGDAWVLGHCDIDRTQHHGPECGACNYATSGRTGCPHTSHD